MFKTSKPTGASQANHGSNSANVAAAKRNLGVQSATDLSAQPQAITNQPVVKDNANVASTSTVSTTTMVVARGSTRQTKKVANSIGLVDRFTQGDTHTVTVNAVSTKTTHGANV